MNYRPRPTRRLDLKGKVFGRLTALEEAGRAHNCRAILWLCQCTCGNLKTYRAHSLKSGDAKSCGCLFREFRIKHGDRIGGSRTKLYMVWSNMKTRCFNPNAQRYSQYGARGITVCEEWMEYLPFKEWALANGYREGLYIDRMDNDGDYIPNNCRWATASESNRNRRRWAQRR